MVIFISIFLIKTKKILQSEDFLFADVSIQISAVSSTFGATDLKHVLLICFDIFSSMFLILNNI